MAEYRVDPTKVHEFKDAAAFYAWLRDHHDAAHEVWIRIYKVGSGRKTITPAEGTEVALCWGWIDGLRKSADRQTYLQRYSPRRRGSPTSPRNLEAVSRLMTEGRMTDHGRRAVESGGAGPPSLRSGRARHAAVLGGVR